MTDSWKVYSNHASAIADAPQFVPIGKLGDPAGYVPDPDLSTAVDVAVALGLPLLVTGDPGCGKTQLAAHIAYRFGQKELIVFHTKTTSTAQDFFYRYDSLAHFHSANFAKSEVAPDVMRFIHPQALGLAILRTLAPSYSEPFVALEKHDKPLRSVVLIDEIDKAPRDFPNDVLDEIDTMSFTIRETGRRVPPRKEDIDPAFRPIVILTSNSERNLPDAFLRRCAYFHIAPPDKKQLLKIIDRRLALDGDVFPEEKIDQAVELFMKVRGTGGLKKRPSTDEFLKWLHMLNDAKIDPNAVAAGNREAVYITCAILSKSREDAKRLETLLTT